MDAKSLIQRHEGLRLKMYEDSRGIATIGYGHNLRDKPISQEAAEDIFQADFTEVVSQLSSIQWFTSLDVNRQAVILDMAFNMGIAGVLQFHGMISAIEAGDYQKAADDMLGSLWAREVPTRAAEDAEIMRTGIL